MRHYSFPIREARHFHIRFSVENPVQRMIFCLFPTAITRFPVQMQRELSNGFCKQSNTCIYRRNLHGRLFIDGYPAVCFAENKKRPGIPNIISNVRYLRRVSRILKTEPVHKAHGLIPPSSTIFVRVSLRSVYSSVSSFASLCGFLPNMRTDDQTRIAKAGILSDIGVSSNQSPNLPIKKDLYLCTSQTSVEHV